MSYEDFKKAVIDNLVRNTWQGLTEEEMTEWENRVSKISEEDIEGVCREHYNNGKSIESCSWCLHWFA